MPRTIESILDAHHAATERRNSGRPVWSMTLNLRGIFHNEQMTLEQRRDGIVAAVRASRWLHIAQDPEGLEEVLDELSGVDESGWFDAVWDQLYDHANIDRVWIETR